MGGRGRKGEGGGARPTYSNFIHNGGKVLIINSAPGSLGQLLGVLGGGGQRLINNLIKVKGDIVLRF